MINESQNCIQHAVYLGEVLSEILHVRIVDKWCVKWLTNCPH